MLVTCKLGRSVAHTLIFAFALSSHHSDLVAEEVEAENEIMACEDASSGQVTYKKAAAVRGDSSCHKLSSNGGTFNQVRDFSGYRASYEAMSDESVTSGRAKDRDRTREHSKDADESGRGVPALTSFESDELQSKRNPKKFQCHVEGETKVQKGCRVEIELIRGALTTVSFSRLGRSSSNTVKWKRVLEGECRDLTVRAVGSGCD